MPIPDYQSIMLPLLQFAGDQKEHSLSEAVESLSVHFKLSKDERSQLLPSGQQEIFPNRVAWAKTYLKKAGLIQSPRRGCFNITDRGLQVLSKSPQRIDVGFLKQFQEFVEFQTFKKDSENSENAHLQETLTGTPEELIELGFQKIGGDLESELLTQIKSGSDKFFERLVVDLLIRMGYGGSRQDAGTAIGMTGDGGIDGVIKEDTLGLDMVYLQAKRWTDTVVGRPEIQKFAGALQGQKARKGVFITTSTFSKEAREYASHIDTRIVLIDGGQLVKLMIGNGVGVSTTKSYELKKIDHDYFEEE